MNPPKIPNWRYLYNYVDASKIPNEVAAYKSHIEEMKKVLTFKEFMPETEKIQKTPPMREIVEEMLIERCPAEIIVRVISKKFGLNFKKAVIKNYSYWFFDLKNCNNYDIAKWREGNYEKQFNAPPVPNDMRSAYMEHVHGEIPNIDPDTALRVLANQTFFRAAELSKYGWDGDKKFLDFAKASVDMFKEVRSKIDEENKKKEQEFDYVVEYPENTAKNADQIEGYDMDEIDSEEQNE